MKEATMKNYVFVYGTLKQGFHNHWLMRTARPVIQGVILCGFRMFSVGAFPVVVRGDSNIVGEVYEVDSMAPLDRLEGNGRIYKRELVPINLPDGSMIQAWIYLYLGGVEGLGEIKTGDWKTSDEW